MRFIASSKQRTERRRSALARMQKRLLYWVSVGVLIVLIGPHFPRIVVPVGSPAQGTGRGAGGVAASAQAPQTSAAVCLPTDINCIINAVSSTMATGIVSTLSSLSDAILKNPADIVYQTPLLTNDNDAQNRAILSLNRFFVDVVDMAFACLLVIAGYNVIVGRHLLLPSSTIMEIVPRAIIAFGAVQFNLWFLTLFLQFENDLTLDVTHVVGTTMLTNLIAGLFHLHGGINLLTLLLLIVLAIMSCMLLIQMIVRIAIVALDLAVAPLGLACFFLPQLMRWGRLWLVTLSTSVLVQFLQVTALGLGGVFITALANTSLVRLDKNLAIAFLAIGTLGLVLKIPNMLQTWALHPMMDTSRSGGGSGSNGETTYPDPGGLAGGGGGGSAGGSAGGGGGTTVTETGSGGWVDGTIAEDAGGSLVLLF